MSRILGHVILLMGLCTARLESGERYWHEVFLDEILDAEVMVIGRVTKSLEPDNADRSGKAELTIDDVLVPHAVVKNRTSVLLPFHLEAGKQKYVVMTSDRQGDFKYCMRTPLDDQGEIERFARAALKLKDRSQVGRTRFSVPFLCSPNVEISRCAGHEIGKISEDERRKIAKAVDPEPLLQAIEEGKKHITKAEVIWRQVEMDRLGAFGLLLAHCGKKEHAIHLRKLIEFGIANDVENAKGVLFGYVMLDPVNALRRGADLADVKDGTFLARISGYYLILLAERYRHDACDRKKCAEAMARFLRAPDTADLAIEQLHRWQRWEHCAAVLDAYNKSAADQPGMRYVRIAAFQYALECPTQDAKALVSAVRRTDPKFVAEMMESLELRRSVEEEPKK